MEFDVTNVNKSLLIKSLFAFSNPIPFGVGIAEYSVRKHRGENVDDLTDEECDKLLEEFNSSYEKNSSYKILDYYKGKPIKLYFHVTYYGRIIADSCHYDSRNGKYRFLEAMLEYFPVDEIIITKKGYRRFTMLNLPKHLVRPKEESNFFAKLIKNTIQNKNEYGKFWEIRSIK